MLEYLFIFNCLWIWYLNRKQYLHCIKMWSVEIRNSNAWIVTLFLELRLFFANEWIILFLILLWEYFLSLFLLQTVMMVTYEITNSTVMNRLCILRKRQIKNQNIFLFASIIFLLYFFQIVQDVRKFLLATNEIVIMDFHRFPKGFEVWDRDRDLISGLR
jgi:hypothetical protein